MDNDGDEDVSIVICWLRVGDVDGLEDKLEVPLIVVVDAAVGVPL